LLPINGIVKSVTVLYVRYALKQYFVKGLQMQVIYTLTNLFMKVSLVETERYLKSARKLCRYILTYGCWYDGNIKRFTAIPSSRQQIKQWWL